MRVVATKVPNDVYEELRKRAMSENTTVSALLRRLILEYLGKPQVNLEVNHNNNEIAELRRRIERLENELKRLAGLAYYTRSKSR